MTHRAEQLIVNGAIPFLGAIATGIAIAEGVAAVVKARGQA